MGEDLELSFQHPAPEIPFESPTISVSITCHKNNLITITAEVRLAGNDVLSLFKELLPSNNTHPKQAGTKQKHGSWFRYGS